MDELGVIRQKNYTQNQKVRDVVLRTLIIGTGNITKVYKKGTRADVALTYANADGKPINICGVEIMRLGTSKIGVFVEPDVGDCVILFATQHYLDEYKVQQNPLPKRPNASLYSNANIKAFVLQPNAELTDGTFIHIAQDNKVTITNKSDVTITVKGNTNITCKGETAITCEAKADVDASGQNVTLKASKVTVNNHLEIT